MRRGSPRWSCLSVGRRSSSSCLKGGGRIDLLVNNAGIGLLGGAEESSTQQAQALFDVNVFGVLRVTNAVLPIMRRQKQGRIINLSSLLGLIPAPYSALYAATKHAIEGYSESLDHELRTWGIRVVLVELAISRNECLNWLFPKGYAVAIGSSAIAGASEFRAALVVMQAAPGPVVCHADCEAPEIGFDQPVAGREPGPDRPVVSHMAFQGADRAAERCRLQPEPIGQTAP